MRVGEVLDDRFELKEVVGEGGMGQVFRAWYRHLEKSVAIKTMLPQFSSDAAAMDQMKREVRLSQRLNHPNTVAVYDWRVHDRIPYIVMQFVDGKSLRNYLYAQPDHRISEVAFGQLAAQILDGIEYAHSLKIVHRDLKPANIMVTGDGQVKIVDFGIADAMRTTYSRLSGKSPGLTFMYASPEQIRGDDPTPAMDIYALGCVFYEMLSGHPPFYQGDIVHQQLYKDPPPLPSAPPQTAAAIFACLTKEPERRLPDIDAVRRSLFEGPTVVTRPRTPVATTIRDARTPPARRDPFSAPRWVAASWRWWVLAGLAGAALAVAVILLLPGRTAPPGPGPAPVRNAPAPSAPPSPEGTTVTREPAPGGPAGAPPVSTALSASQTAAPPSSRSGQGTPAALTKQPPVKGAELTPATRPDLPPAVVAPRPVLPMARLAAGTFVMGSPLDEAGRKDDEVQHTVAIERAFSLDVSEVTYEAFRQFVLARPEWQKDRIDPRLHDGNYLKDWSGTDYPPGKASSPVVYVSWHAARACADWLGRRLPTEAEWEYAARAGTTTAYWWGPSFDPARVGSPAARVESPWRLANMVGSVWEWTSSLYSAYPYVGADGRENPAAGGNRVVRGGFWNSGPRFLRSANRSSEKPQVCSEFLGFRCAR